MNKIKLIEHLSKLFYKKSADGIVTNDIGIRLRNSFESSGYKELELDCANSNFLGEEKAKNMLNKYINLQRIFPDNVIIKESEYHTGENPYYECSVFYKGKDEEKKIREYLLSNGINIDIEH